MPYRNVQPDINSNESPIVLSTPMYKCTECGFVTSDHKQLLVHAFSHKQSAGNNRSLEPMDSSGKDNLSTTTAPGSYVCSICSYFCDSQRTLKAHMWKHSGHKNLEYPTFQNGPLSIYDDTPFAAKNFVNNNQQSEVLCDVKNSAKNVLLLDYAKHNNHAVASVDTAVQAEENSSPRVVVQQLINPENICTIGTGRVNNGSPLDEDMPPVSNARRMKPEHVIEEVVNHLQGAVDDPLKVMTAVCEVAERRPVENNLAISDVPSKLRIDSDSYSATEKTAATLLSLLRQG